MELRPLSDEELIARVESLADAEPGGERLWEALGEVFRRMRAEAKPEKRAYVEAVIARLTRTFSERDDDDEDRPDGGGVREPRRPAPAAGGAAAAAG